MVSEETARTAKPFRWSFFSALAVILTVTVIGEIVGRLLSGLPERLAGDGPQSKDWLLLAFGVCSAGWIWLSRVAVVRFLRSMVTAVSLVVLVVLAVMIGVLVPQMDGFEDPGQRITEQNHDAQYDAFRWAEGYFFYHLMHLYGVGMPEAEIPPSAVANLDRFGRMYGREERDNRAQAHGRGPHRSGQDARDPRFHRAQ